MPKKIPLKLRCRCITDSKQNIGKNKIKQMRKKYTSLMF